MNELFVNVKVDREERPDVDALYMQAVLALTGQGGWPMTVFLTPDGRPFYAGTYFPPDGRGMAARPSPTFAGASARAYASGATTSSGQAAVAARRLAAGARPAGREEPWPGRSWTDAVALLARSSTPTRAASGARPSSRPRWPWSSCCASTRAGTTRRPARSSTLTWKHGRGGIYDQSAAASTATSVDDQWVVPHFEKMLYDNALLARDYAIALAITGEPCTPHRRGDARLPAARDAPARGRVRGGPGRGLARGRGRLLRLDAGRSWARCCPRTRPAPSSSATGSPPRATSRAGPSCG